MSAYYRLTSSADGLYVFSLMSGNHRSILGSMIFRTRAEALDAISLIRQAPQGAVRYERRTSREGRLYYVLVAADGRPLASSSLYRDPSALETGLQAVRREGSTAIVRETERPGERGRPARTAPTQGTAGTEHAPRGR